MRSKSTTVAKIQLHSDNSKHVIIATYGDPVLLTAQEILEQDDLSEADYIALPISSLDVNEIKDVLSGELESMNWHREIGLVCDAVDFMSPAKSIEWMNHVLSKLDQTR